MAWQVIIRPSAQKEIKKLDRPIQSKVLDGIYGLLDKLNSQDPLTNIKQLEGEFKGSYRLRVGDYRVIFERDGDRLIITVLEVGHRREIYK